MRVQTEVRWLSWLIVPFLVTAAGCGGSELELDGELEGQESFGTDDAAIISEADEWKFFDKLNAERKSRGMAALKMQGGLRQISREWSVHQANQGKISHRTDLRAQVEARVTKSWLRMGENVGVGYGVDSLHQAFMNSPGHKANVLGDYQYVGIGAEVRSGKFYVTFSFLKASVALSTVSRPAQEYKPLPASTTCGRMNAGQGLARGQSLKSCDGRFTLILQTDGNLVLYKGGAGALWHTSTTGKNSWGLAMQGDGNLVLYSRYSSALWHTHTGGKSGAFLAVQNDGNLVLYRSGVAIWNSGTAGH